MIRDGGKGFVCSRCGHCCGIPGAYEFDAEIEDLERWKDDLESEILDHLDDGYGWVKDTQNREEVSRCPFLRKDKNKETYKCRIHHTKPSHYRDFPKSAGHALSCGCPYWRTHPIPISIKRLSELLESTDSRPTRYYCNGDRDDSGKDLYHSYRCYRFMSRDYFLSPDIEGPTPFDVFELDKMILQQHANVLFRPVDALNIYGFRFD